MRPFVLSLFLVASCDLPEVPTDIEELIRPPDTGTATDTGDTSDTGATTTEIAEVDPATCALPSLDDHYPGLLPQNPWSSWPSAPACLQARHDVIVILGCPSEDDGSTSSCQEGRVELALSLSDAGYGDQFIVTGAAVHNDHVEAEALTTLLLEAGVPEADIFPEPLAEHTDENIYWSTQIMLDEGWDTALVVSDPEHLMYAAVCDANCCVDLGRLATFEWPVGLENVKAASYVLTPPADDVTEGECTHLEVASKAMCLNLDSRRACADDFQL